MSITVLNPKDEDNKKDTFYLTLSAPGTIVGATVSALVYTTLSTTGELAAAATGTGIELTGNILAYGTELAAGSIPAATIRAAGKTYGALAKPTISNASRLGALGISVLAGSTAALATSAIVYGSKCTGSYLYSYFKDYKQKIAKKIQYPIETNEKLFIIEDDAKHFQQGVSS
jgi:hypothetical protein